MTNMMETLVRRASQVHHAPQVGLPQIAPVAMLMPVKTTPTSAEACASRTAPDRKSTRLNSSHGYISYAVFCLKKKKKANQPTTCHHPHKDRSQNSSHPILLHHEALLA